MGRFFVAVIILVGIFSPGHTFAATSYFSPSSGTVTGATMSVDILVDTKNVAVNNAEMVVRFPNDLLEIVSTSASDSVFSLWVGAPKFSNETGTLSFTAGIPTPGFTGDSGKILNVVFRVKKAGSASLTFSSVIIRANDGYGSNVFQSGAKATLDLSPEAAPVISTPPVVEVLSAPIFTAYPAELRAGEKLNVSGTARPDSMVNLWWSKDQGGQEAVTVSSGHDGRFQFALDVHTTEGVYRLWAEVSDGAGRWSPPSEKIAIVVVRPAIDILLASFVLFLIILSFVIWYVWRRNVLAQKRLRKETLEAESSLHQAFGSLRENRDRLEMFEVARLSRTLTDEEEKIVAWLKRDLDTAEKTVEKEIEDIEEEVK